MSNEHVYIYRMGSISWVDTHEKKKKSFQKFISEVPLAIAANTIKLNSTSKRSSG